MTTISDVLLLNSNEYKNCKNYDEKFSKLANTLLNKTVLLIKNTCFRLREIEIYLYTDDHNDNYTHKSIEQADPCQWYFHKTGSSYKGGTYKGLDITFGKAEGYGDTYGGILIRGISCDDNLVTGSCKVVDYILKATDSETVKDLVDKLGKSVRDVSKVSPLYLKLSDDLNKFNIYTSPRVGLSFKYWHYAVKNYRYLTYKIKDIEKYKPSILVNLVNSGKSIEEVAEESGTKVQQIKKYVDLYKSGQEMGGDFIQFLKPGATDIVRLSGFINKQNN